MTAFIEYEINAIRVPREVPQYHLTSDNKPIIVYTIPFAIAALGFAKLMMCWWWFETDSIKSKISQG